MPTTAMERMIPVPLTTTISVAITTMGNDENTTNVPVTMETTVGKMMLSSDMELLSLTETMGLVAGIVGFIVVMVIMCFVYRTSARTSVRMRKSADRDRRSAATSMELLELNEYDQRMRNGTGLPHASAVNSHLYNRGLDDNDGSGGPSQSIPIPTSSEGGYHGVENDDESYYPNVVLNGGTFSKCSRIHDDVDSDINANDVINGNISSFKVKSLDNTVDKTVLSSNKVQQSEVNTDLLSKNAHELKKKMIEAESEINENLSDIDSPPPTPCSSRPYVNLNSVYANEEEYSKQGYINVDYRSNSIPLNELEDELCERGKEIKRPKGKARKRNKSKAKQNAASINHNGVKGSPANATRDKRRKASNAKEHWILENKPAKPVTKEGVEEQVYLPMNVQDDTDTSYMPMDFPNDRDTHYVPMDSMNDTDTQYLPMDTGTVQSKDVSDNVYIYMENEQRTGDYINCSATDKVYENT